MYFHNPIKLRQRIFLKPCKKPFFDYRIEYMVYLLWFVWFFHIFQHNNHCSYSSNRRLLFSILQIYNNKLIAHYENNSRYKKVVLGFLVPFKNIDNHKTYKTFINQFLFPCLVLTKLAILLPQGKKKINQNKNANNI